MKTVARGVYGRLARVACLCACAQLTPELAWSSCDAKTAMVAAYAQALSQKFSATARMCGDDSPTQANGVEAARVVVPAEDHAEHLSMYDSIDIFVAGVEPEDVVARGVRTQGYSRLPRPVAGVSPNLGVLPEPAAAVSVGSGMRAVALMPAFQAVGKAYGIDHLLLHAIAHVESRHNPLAVSAAGAIGLMQIMPATARRFGVLRPHVDLRNPQTSLQVGAAYLKTLQERFGNNLTLIVAAYNAGEGAVEKYGRRVPPYPETRGYVNDVLAMYRALREAGPERLASFLFSGK